MSFSGGTLFNLKMLPVDELFQGAFLVLAIAASLAGLVMRSRTNWVTLDVAAGLPLGVAASFAPTPHLVKHRLLGCATAAIESREPSPLLVYPEMRTREPNE